MEYSALVTNILGCPLLANAIQDMTRRTQALNLIDPNWKNLLHQHETFKRHSDKLVKYSKGHSCSFDKAYVRSIISSNNHFNVIIAGSFQIVTAKNSNGECLDQENCSFATRQCDPLTEIALAMKENPQQKLNDGARLFVSECNPMMCESCERNHSDYKVPIARKNWCVRTTRVYNGKQLNNEFKSRLLPTLLDLGSTLAIFNVQISSRTTFGDEMYKIGGQVKEMIIFQESALIPCENIRFSNNQMVSNPVPSIEYPEETTIEEAIPN